MRIILIECTENIDAHSIKGYVIHETKSNTQVHVPYPEDETDQCKQILSGRAFHHGRFVMALRSAAKKEKKYCY